MAAAIVSRSGALADLLAIPPTVQQRARRVRAHRAHVVKKADDEQLLLVRIALLPLLVRVHPADLLVTTFTPGTHRVTASASRCATASLW